MKLSTSITIGLMLLAVLVELMVDQKSAGQLIAEQYIGECKSVSFSKTTAFQSSNKTAIFFKFKGFQGPVEALLVITNKKIEKLVIIKSNEGLDKSALDDPNFLKSFEQNLLDKPIIVDAVSGATISSQLIIDKINKILKEWNPENNGS